MIVIGAIILVLGVAALVWVWVARKAELMTAFGKGGDEE
jgi:hypothetical protein